MAGTKSFIALFLLLPALSLPAAAASKSAPAAQMQGDERILHALNRFTFGVRPGDLARVKAIGLDAWFEAQLHPETLDESALQQQLAEYPAMQWPLERLFTDLPDGAMIRQAADGKLALPAGALERAIYANQIYRQQLHKAEEAHRQAALTATSPATNLTTSPATSPAQGMEPAEPPVPDPAYVRLILALAPAPRMAVLTTMEPATFTGFMKALNAQQRKALTADLAPLDRQNVLALENPERVVSEELAAQKLLRATSANAQLAEVMTDFWFNHFNIYLHKNEQMPWLLAGYERDVIRPHALGKFEDLLEAVAHSQAMLLYLDNAQSMGPDSPAAVRAQTAAARNPATKKAPEGLNENYARELMELHTLGVSGGYTQADVVQVARVLTGWTVDHPQTGGVFQFTPNRHEPGTKIVLGQKINESGEQEGRQLLHELAMQPATAHFLARKLAIRFVCDDPPEPLVNAMASAYLQSGGSISAMLRALYHAPGFWHPALYRAKVKTPQEFVVSALRASQAKVDNPQSVLNALRPMGMAYYNQIPPTGYKWDAADWVSTAALAARMNFALALASNHLPGVTTVWTTPAAAPQNSKPQAAQTAPLPGPVEEEARLEALLVAGGASVSTRSAALTPFQQTAAKNGYAPVKNSKDAERQAQLLAGLLLGSPEFQRR